MGIGKAGFCSCCSFVSLSLALVCCGGKKDSRFVCGNGICEDGEDAASCSDDCPRPPNCGNGTLDPGEDCDGTDLAQATCQNSGFDGGELLCSADCQIDRSGCFKTGPVFFVRIDGSDNCSGKNNASVAADPADCAWKTITKATETLTAGQTVRVQAGVYNEQDLELRNSGSAENPIMIIGEGAVLDGMDGLGSAFRFSASSIATNFTVRDFTIQNYVDTAFSWAAGVGSGSKNNVNVINNTFKNNRGASVIGFQTLCCNVMTGFRISRNKIYDSDLTTTAYQAAINIDSGKGDERGTGFVISDNVIANVPDSNGIQFAGINFTISGNNISGVGYNGITMLNDKVSYATIRDNILSNNSFRGSEPVQRDRERRK